MLATDSQRENALALRLSRLASVGVFTNPLGTHAVLRCDETATVVSADRQAKRVLEEGRGNQVSCYRLPYPDMALAQSMAASEHWTRHACTIV
jgi:hypothetical protein